MTVLGDKLSKAIEAKNNDIKNFVWKLARKADKSQEEIRLVDATPEQLQQFHNHCISMLYSTDTMNPGRYTLLNIIKEQRRKCNVEIFLRKLEDGSICADHKPYPRYLYLQDINSFMNTNPANFPASERNSISISVFSGNLPREFERISIAEALNGCLDQLGTFNNKHITFSFILNMGIYLTPAELREFDVKDKDGNTRNRLEVIKESLNINPKVMLTVKPTGLNYNELRAMVTLKTKKYSEMTTDQLTTLRNKVLFKLETEVQFHASQWEERLEQIEKVAKARNIEITDND